MNNNKTLFRYFIIVIAIVGFVAFLGEFQNKNKTGDDDVELVKGKNYIEVSTLMSGKNLNINYQDFKGGEVSSIMGGSEIHLENANINGEATLDLSMIMGGAKIYVPSDWKVVNNLTGIMGGTNIDEGVKGVTTDSKTLILTGYTFMGGVNVSRVEKTSIND